ncbi:uncharacterized protein LOC132628477 [Lycium barbarum]|uniref:uncharacterized protein LOC132628477 n=1 Tax=Lycium barbarum TaxID=112863 RepID=UPI00293F0625|nr:uncharacterized protein LOC132628477 [Lycium barbarum]
MGQVVSSHSTSIKKQESKLSQNSATLNQRQKCTLPSDMFANLKNDGDHKCHAITTRGGKTIGEEKLAQDNLIDDDEEIVEEPLVIKDKVTLKKKRASIEKPIVIEEMFENDEASKGKEAVEEVPRALTPVPKSPHPYPQRPAKKAGDGKFIKFIEKLEKLSINIPLVEALEKMSSYAKFMKDLVTKSKQTSFATGDVTYHYSSIVTKALVQKKKESRAFTIPCTIRAYKFSKALCNLVQVSI